jgi:small ligand-binding sensory domain FIST
VATATARSRAAIVQDMDWERAVEAVLDRTGSREPAAGLIDLAFLFASASYGDNLPALVRRVREATGATTLVGCSGQGIIGTSREIEREPAVSLLNLWIPGASVRATHLDSGTVQGCHEPDDWHRATGVAPDQVGGWLIFADPFRMDVEALVNGLSAAYPRTTLLGGLASGEPREQRTFVFHDDTVHAEGAVALALGGAYTVRSIVSQGAEPISQPWTITGAQGHFVQTIGQRPAMEVLADTLRGLPPEQQQRARRNLLVGLAMDEYRDHFGRGDFLIRNLLGADPKSGVLAIGASPRVGQTIQFQLRDARAADEELSELLTREHETLGDVRPLAAVLCSCNGRGESLFGEPDHDARAVSDAFDIQSVAGFFCNGEIGPVGGRTFVHGYTASIGLIVPTDAPTPS